jgi:rare lipoprotein A
MKNIFSIGLAALLCCGMASAAIPDAPNAKTPIVSNPAHPTLKVSTNKSKNRIVKTTKNGKVQVGTASWYGKRFHGRQTASGDIYDMFQFTAASRTLPLGSMVKVTNLRNGKWVIVKVNDRGPYVGHRVMDVSYGAAQMMGFRQRGLERVKLEVIDAQTVAMAATSD